MDKGFDVVKFHFTQEELGVMGIVWEEVIEIFDDETADLNNVHPPHVCFVAGVEDLFRIEEYYEMCDGTFSEHRWKRIARVVKAMSTHEIYSLCGVLSKSISSWK